MVDVHRLRFGPLPRTAARTVDFVDCPELPRVLLEVLRGWWIETLPAASRSDALMTVRRRDDLYHVEAPWLSAPLRREAAADGLCGFIAELLRALVVDDPEALCLHGAAVELGGRLLVFPNRYRAGKSTLTACFAAAGHRVFADDVVPIGRADDQAFAPGVAPRLRLPLPEDLSEETRAFLTTKALLDSPRYRYLDLPGDRLAPFGTRAEIGAFVLIERDPDAAPGLMPASRKEMLRQVIWQNFARDGDSSVILRRLHRIVQRAGCFRLRYRTAEQGVALLAAAFGQGRYPEPPPCGAVREGVPEAPPSPRSGPQIEELVVEGETFLAKSATGAIHHLNPLASALWRALRQGTPRGELTALVQAAYPEVPAERIAQDVAAVLDDLAAKGLLVVEASREASPPVVPREALG